MTRLTIWINIGLGGFLVAVFVVGIIISYYTLDARLTAHEAWLTSLYQTVGEERKDDQARQAALQSTISHAVDILSDVRSRVKRGG